MKKITNLTSCHDNVERLARARGCLAGQERTGFTGALDLTKESWNSAESQVNSAPVYLEVDADRTFCSRAGHSSTDQQSAWLIPSQTC